MTFFAALICGLGAVGAPFFADTIEDFETGNVFLVSFPGEDVQPDSWALDSAVTHNSSRYALKLFGNTWKVEPIAPMALDSSTVWEVWVYVESVGAVQGFGLVSETETLLYSFAGRERVEPARWNTVYQGAFPERSWNRYLLPVGEDWLSRFGHLTSLNGMVFINDADRGARGKVYFDDVSDVTFDQPLAPEVEAWFETKELVANRDGTWRVTVQFYSRVRDPDSREHFYHWDFGDDATSSDSWPIHTYVVKDNHTYTVLLQVMDESGRLGRDSCRVNLAPGPGSFPLRLNFVGDLMLARRYEPLIDSLGVEAIFQKIKPDLGDVADITVANLECPLTDRGTPHPTKPIVFRGRPANGQGLKFTGIDVVSLANNHIVDYGLEGLRQTQAVLDTLGIVYSGAGGSAYEAYQPVFLVKCGVALGFLAYSDRTGQYDNYQPYLDAGENKPGFANLDTFRVFQAMRRAKAVADFLVLELHSGEEYQPEPIDEGWFTTDWVQPTASQIALRHRIVDQGAALVVCHHPHILQGFEVYQGKLIAHSLGNFAFDQEYPETYPSVILNGLLDERGFYRYWLVPVYIDDYIPHRARGELGTRILRYVARRSRELNSYLVVDRESVIAEVVLDSANLNRRRQQYEVALELLPDSNGFRSLPHSLSDTGDLSMVMTVAPAGAWQMRLGRDLLWMGNMEDEGATFWLLNQADEFYDCQARRGARSLCHRRSAGTGVIVTNLEERMACPLDSHRLGVYGWMKTDNGAGATVVLNVYNSRSGGMRVAVCSLPAVNGTNEWQEFYAEIPTPRAGGYFDVLLKSAGPDSGTGRVWFDDIRVIEWEDWQEFGAPRLVTAPNDYTWIQVRTDDSIPNAVVRYEATEFQPLLGVEIRNRAIVFKPDLTVKPNPAKGRLTINYHLGAGQRADLKVYNSLGQMVRNWHEEGRTRGLMTVNWDLKDGRNKRVPSGTYFFRLEIDGKTSGARVVVLSTEF
ncbi:MAG: CapA family protein [candidate division WOR-3 bacterium]|nr:CapA family protein [candidate division WOR-3 bacterium]MCR4423805.1 CapA family protein [candidate division WOR-3 bacterium]MDH7519144.1 CapA family protein [bacterium]